MNLDQRRAYGRKWAKRNPEKVKAKNRQRTLSLSKASKLRIQYAARLRRTGLTPESFSVMLGEQGCCCKACHRSLTMQSHKINSCCIDHDHKTGKVRGLLCNGCNTAFGLMSEDVNRIRALALYAESFNESPKVSSTGLVSA